MFLKVKGKGTMFRSESTSVFGKKNSQSQYMARAINTQMGFSKKSITNFKYFRKGRDGFILLGRY